MNGDNFHGAVAALICALLLFASNRIGAASERTGIFGDCQRDGFVWNYGDRWECRKTGAAK